MCTHACTQHTHTRARAHVHTHKSTHTTKPGATREEVEAAARAANASGFIGNLPLGFDTQVGPRAPCAAPTAAHSSADPLTRYDG
jgi:hypothetical protein